MPNVKKIVETHLKIFKKRVKPEKNIFYAIT